MEYDLIIAGGGINGSALARLAAFQGLNVALFEADDFGQGASSNTSKLLHGGLRYLETYDFSLVRDATRERAQLLNLAPHLVEAARFIFPKTKHGRHGRLGIKAGLTLYDFLAGKLRISPHRWVTPSQLKKREPHFLTEEGCGAYEYSDCIMDDARLVLENLVDAQKLGASVQNYQSLLNVERTNRDSLEVTVLNRLTGKEVVHQTKNLALALGPWTDKFLHQSYPKAKPQIKLSQGIHLIVQGLASHSCFILPVPNSHRYFFVVPWKGKHLIGTTETEVGEYPPEPLLPLEQEIHELQDLLHIYFPGQNPEVICTLTGLRPLARANKVGTIALSREHEFHELEPGVFSAVGGKYTTHRTFADQYLKFILKRNRKRNNLTLKDIKARNLPGSWVDMPGRQALEQILRTYAFLNDNLRVSWMQRYGNRAIELAEYIQGLPGGTELLPGLEPILMGELCFSIEHEWVKTPVDFLRRRTDIYFTKNGGTDSLQSIENVLLKKYPGVQRMLSKEFDYLTYLKESRHNAVR